MSFFTIGISSYNYGKYIGRGLEAIKNQTFTDYDICISDDASTDNSVDIIESFIMENPQLDITFIKRKKNEGLVANKNTIIEHAKGKWLLLCDSDDWMDRCCLEKIHEIIVLENPDRVISEIAHISDHKVIDIEHIPNNQTKWGWSVHHGSAYKMDIIKEHNIRILGEPDDVYFTLEYTKYVKKMSCIREVLYFWYVHGDSEGRKKKELTSSYIDDFYIKELVYIKKNIDYLKNKNYSQKDIQELRYCFLKWYYFDILFASQFSNLIQKLKYYTVMHNEMSRLDPTYLNNEFVFSIGGGNRILRPKASYVIALCNALERVHLMRVGLLGFHALTKLMVFDQ